ncbi:OmpA family protein [Flavobacterium sp. GN10]|uniref:OmpA family protein n=1 Tax=Flavobacterium tagetis TaxID=2801336 RepID=A0ABS1KER9_9FLAO|nr:OmpA family protein [Flavobacterium tagetis]MBL0737980.1 OmpA family protein [Flavobacterium tagetis]
MSKKLLYLLGIVATIIIGTILYKIYCCNCCVAIHEQTADIENVTAEKSEINPFVLNGPGINFHCNDNFNFQKNNATLLAPVSDSVVLAVENLKQFLLQNPKQKITITGFATSDEKNTTAFENLGLARANDVKAFLVSKGLRSSQIELKSETLDSWKTNGEILLGPVKFDFNESESVNENTEDWNTIKNQINASPLVLYFNTNQSNYNLSKEEHQKVIDISKYLNHVADAKVKIVGHSDNTGSRELNVRLAKKRADFTKKYLVQNGINASQIEVSAKGPDEPISDNDSAEGRAKNRRTVVTIK